MSVKPHFLDTDRMTSQELFERVCFLLSSPRSRRSVTLAGIAECYFQALQEREHAQAYVRQLRYLNRF